MPWLLAVIAAGAALHFGIGIGDSSFFVDEIFSVRTALPGVGDIPALVEATERTPYLYYFGLHGWLYHGGSPLEAGARLSSVIGGVLLVVAVYWMARAFASRRVALVAAVLCGSSPLVLQYAQQVRVYVWVMLAAAVAVGATVRGGRWLWVGAAASVVALWLHYTALLVVVPLCVWLVRTRGRGAAPYVAACAVAQALLVPLIAEQYSKQPDGDTIAGADLSLGSALRVLGTPFDGRWTNTVGWPQVVGALVMVAAIGFAWRRSRLLAVLAAAAPVGVLVVGVLGTDVVVSRFTAVAAPVMLAAVAVAPRVLLVPAVVAIAGGLVFSHGASGRYPPAREAIAYVQDGYEAGDALAVPGGPAASIPLGEYAARSLSPVPPISPEPALDGERVWIVAETAETGDPVPAADAFLEPRRYRAERGRCFSTSATFCVVLAAPW